MSTAERVADGIVGQLHRRRSASHRCEVMPDGRRDPLDKPKRQSVVTVRAIGKQTVEFAGCDRAVFDATKTLGTRRMRARTGGAWLVRQQDADDLMAILEARGYRLEVTL